VVVPNRVPLFQSGIESIMCEGLGELAFRLGFRFALGFHERPVYRNHFPSGLTALDEPCETMPRIGSESRFTARREVQSLLEVLKLPIDDRGRRRAALCAEWFGSRDKPLDADGLSWPAPAVKPSRK